MIVLDVLGSPGAKGSPHTRVHNGRVIVQETKAVKSWERSVRSQAVLVVGERVEPVFVDQPLRVGIVFRLARPAGHWGKKGLKPKAPARPLRKPDLDKCARATLDALTGYVWDDDARVVELGVVKVYAQPGREGARITIEAVDA